MTIKIVLGGPRGNMGKEAIKMIEQESQFSLVGCLVRTLNDQKAIEEIQSLFNDKINIYDDANTCFQNEKPDVYIDLTVADSAFRHSEIALHQQIRVVIGTSGLSADQVGKLSTISEKEKVGCIIAPNFALGSILMMLFSQKAAKFFPDVEIIEKHHDGKIDAPSGTAMKTVEMMKETRKNKQQGHPNEHEILQGARGADFDGMKIHSMRLPGLVAHQEVVFGSESQLLSIKHDAFDRKAYMEGLRFSVFEVMKIEKLIYGLEHVIEFD